MAQSGDRRKAVAVLTSGGDSQGMNATVRAVVRTAIARGADAYAVYEGLQGLVDGGERIKAFEWDSVSGIMHLGGTVIGTARSMDFRERQGRLRAARNLVQRGIDRLVVVGGDGSLTGTDIFRGEWPGLLDELVATGQISPEQAATHRQLIIAGAVGSIDNDMVGTDKTIGADSAMHRIIEAIDALSSTAASHQRSFVVEVMGRHCGYLTVMCAIAGGADYILIPEVRPAPGWEEELLERLQAGRAAGRRDNLVLVAEGVHDQSGNPITPQMVADLITERAGEDTRVTILGHVQRGGSPSAYDRWMPTLMGHAAANEVLDAGPDHVSQLIGMRGTDVATMPLMEAVALTRAIPELIDADDATGAMAARGSSFTDMVRVFEGISKPEPMFPSQGTRIGVIHAGGLAPGMNAAVAGAVRFGISRGHEISGIRGGFPGLLRGDVHALHWGDVEGWVVLGGAELGTSRRTPTPEEHGAVGEALARHGIDALLVIGGHRAYAAMFGLLPHVEDHPGLRIPVICLPASIDNNLPGWDMSIGSDTALNEIVKAIDMIRVAASASRRAFIVETMGRRCGFLAFMSALSVGAEEVYLNEDPPSLARLNQDVAEMVAGFRAGRSFHLSVRNEEASEGYTTEFLRQLFTEESQGLFGVRAQILGHIQQGGAPTAFDRAHGASLAAHCVDWLTGQVLAGRHDWRYTARVEGRLSSLPLAAMGESYDLEARRPREQWWLGLAGVMETLAKRPEHLREVPVEMVGAGA
ncbi:MAG TPA: 6-phosphofructokinase [Candidatus Nanopelagicales bacterium]